MNKHDVIIVGAGMAGIMAATTLKEAGINDVLILEKRDSVGGRLMALEIGEGKADIGCQFFTSFTVPFQKQVLSWQRAGLIKKWFGGTHPRFLSIHGMDVLASKLAEGLNIKLNTKVIAIDEASEGYVLRTADEQYEAKAVIITAPMPLAIEIVNAGNIELESAVRQEMESIQFVPCIVAVFELSDVSSIDALGYIDSKLPAGIERIIDHQKKGISKIPLISVDMTSEWSKDNFAKTDAEILDLIAEKLAEKHFADVKFINAKLKKWRYSEAITAVRKSFLSGGLSNALIFSGGAFLHPKDLATRARLETAVLSGTAAGKEIAKFLGVE